MESLEEAVASFLHLCFVANLQYPAGAGILCTFLQRWVAKLDENGTKAKETRRDMVHKKDKSGRAFSKAFDIYCSRLYVLTNGGRKKF